MVRAGDDSRRLLAGDSPIADEPGRAAGLGFAIWPRSHRAGTLGAAVSLRRQGRPATRVLREAAALGVDLLSGEEPSA